MSEQPTLAVFCFAPPLTDEKLAEYAALAESAPGQVRDAMLECLKPVRLWWDLPESTRTDGKEIGVAHRTDPAEKRRTRMVALTPLEKPHAAALYDLIPWGYEIDAMESLFGGIDPVKDKPLRDAAFHLLWYVRELNNDREPLTADRLK